MRVGLLTTSYPRFPEDSAGRFVRSFAEALRSRGHIVDVLAPADAQEHPGFDARPLRYLPSQFRRTFYGNGVPDNVRHLAAWPGLVAFPFSLLRAASRQPWDAIVSHFGIPCALVGAMVARKRPHLAVWHSADVALASALPPLRALAPHLATSHWCVTERAKESLGLDSALVCPMGADPTKASRSASRQRLGITGDERVVAFVGRLVPIKGVDTLLKAARGLPLRVVIAGTGVEEERLRAVADDRVKFLGAVSGGERDALLAAADVFAMPSRALGRRNEGAPCALLEAQLAGLPVLASASGGLVERVRHGVDGLLVTPDDVVAWRGALEAFLRGELEGMGARGAAANAHLTWRSLAPTIEEALLRKG